MAPLGYHEPIHLERRGVHVDSDPIIVGVIVGTVTLNFIFMLTWCAVRRHRFRSANALAVSSELSDVTVAEKRNRRSDGGHTRQANGQELNYMQMMMSLQSSRSTRQGPGSSDGRHDSSSKVFIQSSSELSLSNDAASIPRRVHQRHRRDNRITIHRVPSMKHRSSRRNSSGSESLYSCVSAPLDYHDIIFKSSSFGDHEVDSSRTYRAPPESGIYPPRRREMASPSRFPEVRRNQRLTNLSESPDHWLKGLNIMPSSEQAVTLSLPENPVALSLPPPAFLPSESTLVD